MISVLWESFREDLILGSLAASRQRQVRDLEQRFSSEWQNFDGVGPKSRTHATFVYIM